MSSEQAGERGGRQGPPPARETADLGAPPEVRWIARRLEDAGFPTWAVGGAVRDALAGLPPGDWDLATAARPSEVQRIFRRTVPVGIEHGTVAVIGRDRKLYELTTFRRDVQTFGRRAVVAFAETLEEDLERRDFTVNAVAWHPLSQQLRDPHGGRADLAARRLRTVGEPATRFAEDRLRALRALRFAGRFGLIIEPATWTALRNVAAELPELSAERIREELFKLLGEIRIASRALSLYQASGALRVLYPELDACVGFEERGGSGDVWNHLLATVDALPRTRPLLRLAALLHDVGKPATTSPNTVGRELQDHAATGAALARQVLLRLKASNADTDRVTHLIAQHESFPPETATDAEVRRWLRRIGRGHLRDAFRLSFADLAARGGEAAPRLAARIRLFRRVRRVLAARPPLEVPELAIGGAELRRLGLRPGPRYGEILNALLERALDDPALNTTDQLLALAEELVRAEP